MRQRNGEFATFADGLSWPLRHPPPLTLPARTATMVATLNQREIAMTQPLILVALDPSNLDAQMHILRAAAAEADAAGAPLAQLLVIEAMRHAGASESFSDRTRTLMEDAVRRADAWAEAALGRKVSTYVAYGDADAQILAETKKLGATALVMGERRQRAIDRVLGSVASAVRDSAPCPVILVPPVA